MSLKVAVSDAGPIHYLLLIGHADILPRLFSKIVIPTQVQIELSRPTTPITVRTFIAGPPTWLEIGSNVRPLVIQGLHDGESAALALAQQQKLEFLADDQAARSAARKLGIT